MRAEQLQATGKLHGSERSVPLFIDFSGTEASPLTVAVLVRRSPACQPSRSGPQASRRPARSQGRPWPPVGLRSPRTGRSPRRPHGQCRRGRLIVRRLVRSWEPQARPSDRDETFPNNDLDPAHWGADISLVLAVGSTDTVLYALWDIARYTEGAIQVRWRIDGFSSAPSVRPPAEPDGFQGWHF
jgi:hypothetical protein